MASLGAWAATAILASGVLVVVGVGLIRRGRRDLHPKAMLAAILLAAAFLVLYLIKWTFVGATHYGGPAWGRAPYLALLLTHTVAATLNLPLVLVAVYWAVRGELARHRAWVRWAVPVWLYAALSGWLIYLVLARYGVPA
ncbi:DUF420 domain-containing protein [Oceanithermus desulfurans]